MDQNAENAVLEIFRRWNALLGKNKWNLPEISDRTHQRWFNEGVAPSGEESQKVASAVWRFIRPACHDSLRKHILDVVHELAPLAPVDSWDEDSCGAWFRIEAESARKGGSSVGKRILLDAKAVAEIRADYLRWVIRECAPLRLQAIDQSASRPGKGPIGLSSVYVDLNLDLSISKEITLAEHLEVEARVNAVLDKPDLDVKDAGARGVEGRAQARRETRLVPALEALAEHDKFVLLGAPGSGKSTVTAFVALQLARALLNEREPLEKLGAWWKHGRLLPVRVVLRQFAAKLKDLERGRAGHLWDFIRTEVNYDNRAEQTVECIRQIAQNTGALFLLDGLDEVRDEKTRCRMLEAVVEFIEMAGPRCRFLLTSRPYAWEDLKEFLRRHEAGLGKGRGKEVGEFGEDFVGLLKRLVSILPVSYRLAPLDEQQIKTFITHWYKAVADAHWIAETEAARKREELINAAASQRPDLFELAKNPLLLTLMATLHTNRARLPDDRADLYNEVVELLLQRWNETSGADQGLLEALQIPTLKLGDLREVMEQLAFDAHTAHAGKGGVADIPEDVLVSGLRPLLGNSADKAETALSYIENRAGLLLGQGERGRNRQYTFPHRTFQEYLAACHLANQPDFYGKAADLARENPAHWQEVLPLAARHAKAGRGVPAADALIRRQKAEDAGGPNITEADWRAATLAGRQLLEIGLAALESRAEHQVVRDRVAGWLAMILQKGVLPAAEREQAGIILGKLGDPRVGVGLKAGLPDIDWVELPAGKFKLGETGKRVKVGAFKLSRYPITWRQYQAFVDDKGYEDDRPFGGGGFWTKEGLEWRKREKIVEPAKCDPIFQTPNHPQVGVSWYEAAAFCRWLSAKRGLPPEAIRLPHEAEWEWAARCIRTKHSTSGKEDYGAHNFSYPWGSNDRKELAQRCNMGESGIGHASAVGLFPSGRADCGAMDLSGNVWEWCGNWYDEKEKGSRVLRGGSWLYDNPAGLLASFRYYGTPDNRGNCVGFRCVWLSASSL
jgi:formylglycine-generating enzyme required for sulfatase activity